MWLSTECTLSIERMWRKKALTITFDKKEEIKSVLEPNEPTSGRLFWLPWHEATRSITTPPWMGYQSIARLLLGDWTLVKHYGMYVGTTRKNIKRCWVELMCGRLFPAITVTPPPQHFIRLPWKFSSTQLYSPHFWFNATCIFSIKNC